MKVLIANRGEIAVRIIRACRELGLGSVAVYSDADRTAPHVRDADEAYRLGPGEAAQSYLSIERVVAAAERAGADAVHPGYGFLAENAAFARACRDAGLVFIGPAPDVIERMGSKTAAREAAIAAGVPVVPGTVQALRGDAPIAEVDAAASSLGFPLLIKAVSGGGGKGMRRVSVPADLPGALRAARSEALASFGDAAVYLERRLSAPRHVEVQLLGDARGTVVAFVERECSIQRRYQKMLEESPSPVVDRNRRRALADAATALARAVGYTNAGTIEFLLDDDGRFYFLEMNTRLQVEHPVTEEVSGIDLVRWQLRLARGERLELDPERLLEPRGHAIECRLYAEDPDTGFLPSPGRIDRVRPAGGPGVRDDTGVAAGFVVPMFYDSMLSKLISWGESRTHAIARMQRALAEYEIGGVKTTIPFFRWLLAEEDFAAGRFDTTYVDRVLEARAGRPFGEPPGGGEGVGEAAVMGVALEVCLRPVRDTGGGPAPESAWKRAARQEALR